MAIRMLVADRHGRLLAELPTNLQTIAWRLNKIGKTTFTIAVTEAKATEENLRFGNRLLIEFSEDLGLPAWGGVIDPPRVWYGPDIAFTAYTIEHVLQYRRTVKTRAFWSAPIGNIFHQLLIETQAEQDMGITYGRIWTGGGQHSPRYHFKSVWDAITRSLLSMESADVHFVPYLEGGHIRFRAELYESLGEDKSGKVLLKEGRNAADPQLTEQGTIINDFAAAGAGTGWGDDRLTSVYEDTASIGEFGLRQDSKVFAGVSEADTLNHHALSAVEENSYPHTRLKLVAANLAPARFADYDIGDVVNVQLPTYGFFGYDKDCRVLTREYNPHAGTCTLVLEERTGASGTYRGTGQGIDEETSQ